MAKTKCVLICCVKLCNVKNNFTRREFKRLHNLPCEHIHDVHVAIVFSTQQVLLVFKQQQFVWSLLKFDFFRKLERVVEYSQRSLIHSTNYLLIHCYSTLYWVSQVNWRIQFKIFVKFIKFLVNPSNKYTPLLRSYHSQMTITFSKIKSILKWGLNLIWETFRLTNYWLKNLLNIFNLVSQIIFYVLIDCVFLFTQRIKLLNKKYKRLIPNLLHFMSLQSYWHWK